MLSARHWLQKTTLAFSLILTLGVSNAFAAASPKEVTESYFKVLQERQWDKAPDFYDPLALRDFREMLGFLAELPEEISNEVLPSLFGQDATPESIKKLDNRGFFATFLKGVMARSAEAGQLNFEKLKVVGEVREKLEGSSELAHVVTRNVVSVGEIEMEAMEVVSLRSVNGEWKMLFQGKLKGMAQQIRKALASQAEAAAASE